MHWPAKGLALCLVALAGIAHGADQPIESSPGWAPFERIRAYWSPPLDLIAPLHDAGFNTIIQRLEIGTKRNDPAFNDAEEQTRASSRLAKQLGMHYFHCLDPGAMGAIPQAGFEGNDRRFHDGKLPCPLDELFWERVMTGRFLDVIEMLSGEDYRLDGLIIDPEMYTFNGAFITIPCYCDDCAAIFPQHLIDGDDLVGMDLASRADWLSEHVLLDDYEEWQQDTVTGRLVDMRERIHAKRPDLILGFLIFRDRPWFKALAAGLSTPERPVLICPEGTYSGAYNDDYLAYQAGLNEIVEVPYSYCPGIWVGYGEDETLPTAFMEVVPGNVYQRSIRSSGYWVYASHRWGGNGEKAKPFTDLFRRINDELDRYRDAEGRYESALVAQPLPLERPGNLHELLLEARDWQPVVDVPSTVPRSNELLALRGQHQAVINARKGDEITVSLRNYQLGSYTSAGRIVIYNPGMEVIADEICGVNQRIDYAFTVTWEGPYVVLASAGSGVPNAFSLDIQGAPWVLSGKQIHFNKRGGFIYFWVPEAMETINLALSGAGKETVTYRLYSPDGIEHLNLEGVDVVQKHQLRSDAIPGIWALQISDIVDDGQFSIEGVDRFALKPEFVVTN